MATSERPSGCKREHPDVEALRIRRLDQPRLAGRGIHGQHRDRVLHAFGDDLFAPENFLTPTAIRDVKSSAVGRVHADRRCRLSWLRPGTRRQKIRDEQGFCRKPIVLDAERMQLVLRLDDDVDPPAGRMKLDVTAAKLTAAVRCYGLLIRELTVGVVEYLEATEILFPLARESPDCRAQAGSPHDRRA